MKFVSSSYLRLLRYSLSLNPKKYGRVYPAGKNFTGRINPALILPLKLNFYRQNKSRSYSAGKT